MEYKPKTGDICRLQNLSEPQEKFAGNNGALVRIGETQYSEGAVMCELLTPKEGQRKGFHSFTLNYIRQL